MEDHGKQLDWEEFDGAWATLESTLGSSFSVDEFLRRVGVPAHCDVVTVTPYPDEHRPNAEPVLVSATSTATGLTIILVVGCDPSRRGGEVPLRYCILYGVVRDMGLDDPREIGLSGKLIRNLVDFFGSRRFNHIEALCSRSAGHHGYYVWARTGFNGFVPPHLIDKAVGDLELARERQPTIECIFRAPEGSRWWRQWGTTYWGRIKLLENSRSFRFFLAQGRVI